MVLMHVFYIPGLLIPFTWIDVLVIIIGAIMFFFIDTRLEELSGGMTVKLKKMIHL